MQPTDPNVTGDCTNHPGVGATASCQSCGKAICPYCQSQMPDGRLVCAECSRLIAVPAESAPPVVKSPLRLAPSAPAPIRAQYVPPLPALAGKKCIQHPEVDPVRLCRVCAAPMCWLCDFLLPGDVHLCPVCVLTPAKKISTGRKALMITGYVLAVWNTIGLAILFSGALANVAQDERVIGLVFSLLIFAPSLIGTALCISAFDRRLRTPGALWGATIWNGLMLVLLLVLVVIGNLSGE